MSTANPSSFRRPLPVTVPPIRVTPPPLQVTRRQSAQQIPVIVIDKEVVSMLIYSVIAAISLTILLSAFCYAWPSDDGHRLLGNMDSRVSFFHGEKNGSPWHSKYASEYRALNRLNPYVYDFSSEKFLHSISGWLVMISFPSFLCSGVIFYRKAKKLFRCHFGANQV